MLYVGHNNWILGGITSKIIPCTFVQGYCIY
jgi:hypothetical protein